MPWLIAGIALLLTAGFAKLSTIVVNRLLSIPQPKLLIGFTEVMQTVLIAIYLGLVIASLRRHPQLTFSDFPGQSSDSILLAVLVVIGVGGLLLLINSAIAYQCYRPPGCQIAVESKIFDVRRSMMNGQGANGPSWTKTLVGRRPMRTLALLPGNEQFTVEVATKTYALPRLPKEWDGLSIVHLSDTHFRGGVACPYFEFVCQKAMELQPDLFVFTGDLLDEIARLDWLPATFGRLKAPLGQYFILGNHDWYQDPSLIRRELEKVGWTDIAGLARELSTGRQGPPIVLAGDETPWMGKHPDLTDDASDPFRILLSHTPDNIDWARSRRVDLMLAGHTHGGQIRLPVIGPVYSPSRFGCRFASGVFWLDPTLLYVSRGISGREPIRFQCAPELTKLVLTVPI